MFIDSNLDIEGCGHETFRPRIAARREPMFGSAPSKSKDTKLVEPSAVEGFGNRPAEFNKRAHFSATVKDASSTLDTEKSSNSKNNKSKGKAVSRHPHSTEPVSTKKRVSPEPRTPASAPVAKKDAVSSGGGLMGSAWAEAAKYAGHTSAVNKADDKASGGIPELSAVGAAPRAAAEQMKSVPDVPGSMFAPKLAPSGVSVAETTTTQQFPAPTSLFGSAPGSMFAPAPASAPAPAPGLVSALSSFASSPFASGSVGPSLFAPGMPSFAGPSVRPNVAPVEEPAQESVKEAAKDSVKTVQELATDPSTQTLATHQPAIEKTKKAKFGGLFDSKYAS